eukprot:2840842-Pleurochrysis_carterae.AAC.1
MNTVTLSPSKDARCHAKPQRRTEAYSVIIWASSGFEVLLKINIGRHHEQDGPAGESRHPDRPPPRSTYQYVESVHTPVLPLPPGSSSLNNGVLSTASGSTLHDAGADAETAGAAG